MVPVSLWLRNFLSYGEGLEPLNLKGVPLAALVGNNGAGKSALLDALTWTLFGKARTDNDGLLRKGASEMEAILEFSVEAQLYRVRRRFNRSNRRTIATLEQHDKERKRWLPIARESVRRVDEEIQRLLRMDHETFINTIFMPQGRSGEFMSLTPAKRRDVLATVLGLDAYEGLAEKAKEKARLLSAQIAVAEGQIRHLEQEIIQRPHLVAEFEIACKEQEKAEQALKALDDEIQKWQADQEELTGKKVDFERWRTEEKSLQQQIADAKRHIADDKSTLEQWQKVFGREAEIVRAKQAYEQAQKSEEALVKKAEQAQGLERQQQKLERAIEQAKGKLESELQVNETQRRIIESQLVECQSLLSKRTEVERQLKELQKARTELSDWNEKQKQLSELQRQEAELERCIAIEQSELARREGELQQEQQQYQARIAQKIEVQKRLQTLNEAQKQLGEWQKKAEEAQQKQQQAMAQLSMLQMRKETIERSLEETREKLRLLEEHAGEPRCPLCESTLTPQRSAALRRKLTKELERLQGELRQTEREITKMQEMTERFSQFIQQAQSEIQKLPALSQKLGELQKALAEIIQAEEALKECDLQLQLLQRQKAEAKLRWGRERKVLDERERAIGYDAEKHKKAQERVAQLAKAETIMAQLQEAEKKANQLDERLGQLEQAISAIQLKLKTGDYAHSEQEQLRQAKEQLQSLGYDSKQHQKLRDWLRQNQHILQWWQQLQVSREQAPLLQKRIQQEQQKVEAAQKRLCEIGKRIEELQRELTRLGDVEAKLRQLEAKRRESERQLRPIAERVGGLRQKLEELAGKEQESNKLREQVQIWREERMDYELLAEAFGRYGIPQLILQAAVGWLENDASMLLQRLTNGRMHLRFALTQPTQKGGEQETLNIIIADELGDRPYEAYSGGEKFRIDFAVRIALARLLARRSGAALRTLVIDEGFGSQDKEGLEALVGAIQAIGREFDKVLVITHLDELRDQFPVLIEVTKDHRGSRYRVLTREEDGELPSAKSDSFL